MDSAEAEVDWQNEETAPAPLSPAPESEFPREYGGEVDPPASMEISPPKEAAAPIAVKKEVSDEPLSQAEAMAAESLLVKTEITEVKQDVSQLEGLQHDITSIKV